MRNFLLALVTLALSAAAYPAFAQPQPGVSPGGMRPTYSPYLNFGRGGNPALNYFGLVRPEQQLRQQANTIQQQVTANARAIQSVGDTAASGDSALPVTGRGATFNFTSHYFNNFPLGGAGGGGGGLSNRTAGPASTRTQIGQTPQSGGGAARGGTPRR
jgi:hypothetical protein